MRLALILFDDFLLVGFIEFVLDLCGGCLVDLDAG